MKSGSHSQQLKWSMGGIKKGGGSINITTPGNVVALQKVHCCLYRWLVSRIADPDVLTAHAREVFCLVSENRQIDSESSNFRRTEYGWRFRGVMCIVFSNHGTKQIPRCEMHRLSNLRLPRFHCMRYIVFSNQTLNWTSLNEPNRPIIGFAEPLCSDKPYGGSPVCGPEQGPVERLL